MTSEEAIAYVGGWEMWQATYPAVASGQLRIGQAWFNLLTARDQERIRGHVLDPFYRDDWDSVFAALSYLNERNVSR